MRYLAAVQIQMSGPPLREPMTLDQEYKILEELEAAVLERGAVTSTGRLCDLVVPRGSIHN